MALEKFQQSNTRILIIFSGLALIIGGIVGLLVTQINNPLYIFVGLIGLICFAATVISTEFGLLFLVFITYSRVSDVAVHFHNVPSIYKTFIVLLVVAIFTRWAIFQERPRGWQRPLLLIGAYGLVGFASLLYAQDTERVVLSLSDFWKDAVIAIIVVILLQRGSSFRHVIWTLLLAGIFIGSLSVFQYLTKTFTNDYGGFAQAKVLEIVSGMEGYRIAGPVSDPNVFAQIMLFLVPLALERMINERRWFLRIFAGWALIVSTLSVIFTFSRGGFLAMAVAGALIFIFYPPRPKHIPVFLGIMIGMMLIIPPSYYERIFTLKQAIQAPAVGYRTEDIAIRGRASENLTAWEVFRDYPYFGVGLSNYSSHYPEYSKKLGFAPSASEREAHNLYLEVAAETGVVGLAVFSVLIWVAITTVLSVRKKFKQAMMNDYVGLTTAFFIAMIGFLTAHIFIHNAYPRYFYTIIGIALSLRLVAENTLNFRKSSPK